MTKAIGILGGTFDPIHIGHIELSKQLYRQLNLAEVRFLPCKQPLLKAQATANNEQRLAMLAIACMPYPYFKIDERELQRATPSYMVDTLQSLRREFPNTPLCLIIGSDAYTELPQWHQWQQLITLAHLVVVGRPALSSATDPQLESFYQQHKTNDPQALQQANAGFIHKITLPPMPYASRDIRQDIRDGKGVRATLPPGVWEYINKHQLYQQQIRQ